VTVSGVASVRPTAASSLETSFERALASLWMAYQPIIHAGDHTLFGYEALVRCKEPTIPHPGALLDAAHQLGRLHELGQRIRAIAPLALTSAPAHAALFVNLHATDLLDETLFDADAPLSRCADRVVLEITERATLEDIPDLKERTGRLRALGFRLAVDDLGAGYAGLTSFVRLEPELVKLDMSLVRDVAGNRTKQKLVRSMTTVCKDLGALVVAEGVETPEERDALVELEVDLLQGYRFARPEPPFPSFKW
jgi:EAL domain-containing protein (putative c-di-GMP-specific phosphodiesterase class I)